MLPQINRSLETKSIQLQLLNSSREFSHQRNQISPIEHSRSASAKAKQLHHLGKIRGNQKNNKALRSFQYGQNRNKIIRLKTQPTSTYSQEIRQIDKKIRQCKRKLQQQKIQKMQEQSGQQQKYINDFQKIVKQQLQLQRNNHIDIGKEFDYLTNPNKISQQEEDKIYQQQLPKVFSIDQGIEKLQRFYQNSLKKKFQRREIFPHKAWRRKAPKLYITQKTNAISKLGKPQSEEQHKFRVYTKQVTPQQIYTAIPSFPVVKDNLSKNIVAYLGDYKPFVEKAKEKIEKDRKKEQPIVIKHASIVIED